MTARSQLRRREKREGKGSKERREGGDKGRAGQYAQAGPPKEKIEVHEKRTRRNHRELQERTHKDSEEPTQMKVKWKRSLAASRTVCPG